MHRGHAAWLLHRLNGRFHYPVGSLPPSPPNVFQRNPCMNLKEKKCLNLMF